MMDLGFIIFLCGLAVSDSEELYGYQSMPTESATFKTTLPDQNNSSHNSRKVSTESLRRLTVALITSPGTNLFHVPHESYYSTALNSMSAAAEDVISTSKEGFVSGRGSGAFTLSVDIASAVQRVSGVDLPLISDVQEVHVLTSAQPRSGPVMNGTITTAAHLSRGREKTAASFHAPLNSKNQRVTESITLLPAKSFPLVSATDPAIIGNLGETTETVGRQRKRAKENGDPKALGTTNPLNATLSIFTNGEKTFEQKSVLTMIRVTAALNRSQLANEAGGADVKILAQEPGERFSNMPPSMLTLNTVTHHGDTFVYHNTTLPVGSFRQETVKEKAEDIKLLATTVRTSVTKVHTNTVNEKLYAFKVSHPSNVLSQRTASPAQMHFFSNTESFTGKLQVTSTLTANLLQTIARHESESELPSHSLSSGDGREGMTVHLTSQTTQSTTLGKDEELYKFLTILPKKFPERPSVLIKVKNATRPENALLIGPLNISSADRHFGMPEDYSNVSVENRTLHPLGNEISDRLLILIDNRSDHFHTLVNKLILGASSTAPFAIARRVVTESALSSSDSTVQNGKILIRLTPSALITSPINMHHSVTSDHPDMLQKMPTPHFQTSPRMLKNVPPNFEAHTVTYSPVKHLLIPSLTGNAKTLTSGQTSNVPFLSSKVLKENSSRPLGFFPSETTFMTFHDSEKLQSSTSSYSANKNRELPEFQKESTDRISNTWPTRGKSPVNSSYAQFTRTAVESDKRRDLLLSMSSVTSAAHTFIGNTPTTTEEKNLSMASLLNKLKFFFLPPSLQGTSREAMPSTLIQDSVSHPSHTPIISKILDSAHRGEINGVTSVNQTSANKSEEKLSRHSKHGATSIESVSGTQEQKNAEKCNFRGESSTYSTLKLQSPASLAGLLTARGKISGPVAKSQNSQDAFSMQIENWAPVTFGPHMTVPSSQSQTQDLQKTEGQINTSVSPAAVESVQSTQPLASSTTAESPKTVGQMINQTSSLQTTSTSIITPVSPRKDINGPLLSHPEIQSISARGNIQVVIQNLSTTEPQKRPAVPISEGKLLGLNLSTSPPPSPSTGSMNSSISAHSIKMQSASRLLSSAPSSMTDRAHQRTSGHPFLSSDTLEINAREGQSTQALLPSVTEATFLAIDTDVSLAALEMKRTESTQTDLLQLSEESEGRLSTITPFELSSIKSTELMSDLPVMRRRVKISSPDFLSGLAQISDSICGSGNYTAEMRLNLERDIMPGDLVPALGNLHVVINLKTNNSQVNLEIKSCCLSPTVRLDEFNTTCCLFSRLPVDPQGIRLLPSVLSKRASFTISLFQMINYSTAYLHCDLSVCLRNHSECERCQQQRNAHSVNNSEIVFNNVGNRISFGPVLKKTDDSSSFMQTAAADAETVVILGSVSSCSLVCVALLLLWTINRHHLQRSRHCRCWTPCGRSPNREPISP